MGGGVSLENVNPGELEPFLSWGVDLASLVISEIKPLAPPIDHTGLFYVVVPPQVCCQDSTNCHS